MNRAPDYVDQFYFECPMCDSSAAGAHREYITQYAADHMRDVHGGPYTAADDLEQSKLAGTSS